MGDIETRVTLTRQVVAQTIASNTTVKGSGVDLRTLANQGHDIRVAALCSVGTRTDGTYTFHLQDSDVNTDGNYADVTLLSGSLSASSTAVDKVASYVPVAGRPWVRITVASTSVTTGAQVAAYLMTVPAVV